MERRENLPVLPSNAPALSPRTSILSSQPEDLISPPSSQVSQKYNRGLERRVCNFHHICSTCQQQGHRAHLCQSGTLRATSGNASLTPPEPSLFDNKFRNDSHHEGKPASAFVNTPYHTAQAAIRLTQKKERRNTWQRWEVQSPRYLAYRRKARSKKAGSKEDVWPDDVEEAFQIAIRLYAKRGRRKDELNGRQAGGNEFISDWIQKQTGQARTRKQISSHIQTLKGFLGDVPAWMDLVTAWPAGRQERAKAIKYSCAGYEDLDIVRPTSLNSVPSILRRDNPNTRPPPSAILGSNIARDPTIRGVQFDMHLSNEATNKKTHIYTSIQCEIGSSARTLGQVPHWQDMFPSLATRYNEGRIDCPLFLFESRLRLIDDICLGLSLGIEFAIDFAEGAYFHDWRSLTRVHKQDITPQYFDDSEFEQTWDRLESLESSSGQSDIQLTVPFKSKWWVKLFSSIIFMRDRARNVKDREAIKRADEYPAAYLRELSIVQELWATPRGISSQPQRMAILLWKFSQTSNGEAATTTWRPLTLNTSKSQYHVQGPILRGMQPSMDLDSAIQDSVGLMHQQPDHQQTSDFYTSHNRHAPSTDGLFSSTSEALLATHLSECNTSSTTPILDYTSSFPSSTSASFPSSISNASGYHHGSSFDSQDSRSTCYTQQSFDSSFHSHHHDSAPNPIIYAMPPHPTTTFKHHSNTPSFPDPQDLLYPSQPGSVYGSSIPEYHHHHHHHHSTYSPHRSSNSIDDPTLIVEQPTTNARENHTDFTGGTIHLAYAGHRQTEQLSPITDDGEGFQAHLVAPRANILPLQQVGDCLLSFESWVPPPPATPALVLGSQRLKPHHADDEVEEEEEEAEDDDDDGDTGSEQICGNGRRQSLSSYHHNPHRHFHTPLQHYVHQQVASPPPGPPNHTGTSQADGEADDVDDAETQRLQQLQYLHDAQDHWQLAFQPVLWAENAMDVGEEGEAGGVELGQGVGAGTGPG